MFCFDEVSCNERYQNKQFWMSSTKWESEMAQARGAETCLLNVCVVSRAQQAGHLRSP